MTRKALSDFETFTLLPPKYLKGNVTCRFFELLPLGRLWLLVLECLKVIIKKLNLTGTINHQRTIEKKQIELINRGRIKDVIMEEINNIRSLFGSKYDKEIREMLKYVNKLENNDWVA